MGPLLSVMAAAPFVVPTTFAAENGALLEWAVSALAALIGLVILVFKYLWDRQVKAHEDLKTEMHHKWERLSDREAQRTEALGNYKLSVSETFATKMELLQMGQRNDQQFENIRKDMVNGFNTMNDMFTKLLEKFEAWGKRP